MKKSIAAPLSIAILTIQAVQPGAALPPADASGSDRPVLDAGRPHIEQSPAAAGPRAESLRCSHPISERTMTGKDCVALLSVLLLGALAHTSDAAQVQKGTAASEALPR